MKITIPGKSCSPFFVLIFFSSIFAQQPKSERVYSFPEVHVIAQNKDAKLEFLKSTRDTSSLFYYSFERQKTIKFREFLEESSFSFVTSCNGSNLVLSAPDYGKEAKYEWEGPNNFHSLSSEIILQNIDFSDDGIYTVVVTKGNLTVYGKIKLIVKETPVVKINETEFYEGEVIHIQAVKEDQTVRYTWENPERKVVSKSENLWLAAHEPGKYFYKLTVDKNGCKVVKEFAMVIVPRSQIGFHSDILQAIRNADQKK